MSSFSTHLALHKRSPFGDVQWLCLCEPGMAVNPCSFVIPTFIERGVDSNGNDVAAAVLDVVRDVEAERRITAQVSADIETVEEQNRIPKYTVELDRDAHPFVGGRDIERPLVPTNARFGKVSTECFSFVGCVDRHIGIVDCHKWQLHRPVVREIDNAPGAVVKAVLK